MTREGAVPIDMVVESKQLVNQQQIPTASTTQNKPLSTRKLLLDPKMTREGTVLNEMVVESKELVNQQQMQGKVYNKANQKKFKNVNTPTMASTNLLVSTKQDSDQATASNSCQPLSHLNQLLPNSLDRGKAVVSNATINPSPLKVSRFKTRFKRTKPAAAPSKIPQDYDPDNPFKEELSLQEMARAANLKVLKDTNYLGTWRHFETFAKSQPINKWKELISGSLLDTEVYELMAHFLSKRENKAELKKVDTF